MNSPLHRFLDSVNRSQWRAEAWIFWEFESANRLTICEAWGFGQQNVAELEARWQGNQTLLQQALHRQVPIRATAQMMLQQGSSRELEVVAVPVFLDSGQGVLQFFFVDQQPARQVEQQGIEPFRKEFSDVWKTRADDDVAGVASQVNLNAGQDLSLKSTGVDWQEEVSQVFVELPAEQQVSALLDLFCLAYRLSRCSLWEASEESPELLGVSGIRHYEPRSQAIHFLKELASQLRVADELQRQPLEEFTFSFEQPREAENRESSAEIWTLPVSLGKTPEGVVSTANRSAFLLLETSREGFDQDVRNQLLRDWSIWRIAFCAQTGAKRPRVQTGLAKLKWLAVATALAVVLAIPIPLTIQANGYYWPAERVNLFSPESGVILADELRLPADRQVQSGQLLLTITSRELELEIGRTDGELATVSEQIRSLRSVRPERPGETGSRQTVERDVSIKLAELAAQQAGLQQKLSLLKTREQGLKLSAPLSGEILTWDAQLQLSGRPVSRGSLLLTIGKVTDEWDVLAEVRDRDLGLFKQALQRGSEAAAGQVRIRSNAADAEESTGKVEWFSPVVEESSPGIYSARVQVRVDSQVTAKTGSVRPGTRVTVLADAGRYPAGYVWFRHLWESCQRWFVW